MLHVTVSRAPARPDLCIDFESRPSAFWYGDKTTAQITAMGWKWSDEPHAHTMLLQADGKFVQDDGGLLGHDDAYLLFRDALCAARVVFGHNVRRFDLPLFQAGLLRRRLPILPPLRTTDTLRDYPKRHDMSANLENLAHVYNLRGRKLHMAIADWEEANQLQPDGLVLARKRVASDVLLQDQLRGCLDADGLLRPPRIWNP